MLAAPRSATAGNPWDRATDVKFGSLVPGAFLRPKIEFTICHSVGELRGETGVSRIDLRRRYRRVSENVQLLVCSAVLLTLERTGAQQRRRRVLGVIGGRIGRG